MLQRFAEVTSSYDYSYGVDDSTTSAATGGSAMGLTVFYLVVVVLAVVGMWKVFTKAGKPGWAAIVPVYNGWVLAEVDGKPGWWGLLLLIPFVNIVVSLLLAIEVAKKFGKSTVFGVVALWLFSIVGYLILGFGKDQYQGAATGQVNAPAAGPLTSPVPPNPADTTLPPQTSAPQPPVPQSPVPPAPQDQNPGPKPPTVSG